MAMFSRNRSHWAVLLILLATVCCFILPAASVKHENFKTCDQSGFCRRNRAYADGALAQSSWTAPYQLDAGSIKFSKGQLTATLLKTINKSGEKVNLPITITFLESGTARVTVDEERRQKGDITLRHDSKARKERYNEAESWAIVGGTQINEGAATSKEVEDGKTKVVYGPASKFEAIITHSPFAIEFKREGETQIKLNDRGLLNYEHWRPKVDKPVEEKKEDTEYAVVDKVSEIGEDESTWWEETFGGNTDSKPRGPESVAMDISFPGYSHVYGIAEHSGPLSLRQTRGGDGEFTEPYRMYNSDVFEYEMNSPMTLYGSIPFMQAHKKDSTVGVFWLNAAETWVDITKKSSFANPLSLGIGSHTDTETHWISESGLLDVFVFLGPTPQDVLRSYTELTGTTQLPNDFSIGHHQCRWNYVTDEDVKDVDRKFDKSKIPYDVIWLDIEYTDGKKYFTWDPLTFPDPIGMQQQLDEHGRKLVAIIDPHIKNEGGYSVVDEMKSKDLAVHNKDDNTYEGWCWPGSSHWVDSFSTAARKWWGDLFQYSKFPSSMHNMWLWNDMNEPSVFNGPETTMPKDNMHAGGWEHRDVHNIYGMTVVNATYHGLKARNSAEAKAGGVRPFILTRSFYAGSQRLGALWTGDNQANWDHLKESIPMVLNLGVSGFPFAGADVGGFFGNPERDLLVRWYQAGAFYPYFRAHAHIDTRRREPYLLPDYEREIVTQALRLRYALLPAWYTAFHTSHVNGSPIVQPMWFVHPGDEKGFAVDDQMYLGGTGLLVKPIVREGETSTNIYLPDNEKYFDYFDYTLHQGPGSTKVEAPLEKLPLLMRGGYIFPRRDRPRRSSGLMKRDPFTLVVVLGNTGDAEGELYLDDGESFDYEQGAFIHRKFKFSSSTSSLTSEDITAQGKKSKDYWKSMQDVRVEKVIIVNAPKSWKGKDEVEVDEQGAKSSGEARKVALRFVEGKGKTADWAVVRDPGVAIGGGQGWKISFA